MTVAATIRPSLLSWAVERGRREEVSITKKWPMYQDWLTGSLSPSMSQLEDFARYTHTPLGYFFLPQPPDESVPIPDFRTLGNQGMPSRPSADLLDTIYACQSRQEWYREYAEREEFPPLTFAGSVSSDADVRAVAEDIINQLGFDMDHRKHLKSRDAVRSHLIHSCEDQGILVTVSGIVGSNTHRALDSEEFRGFTLFDTLAPLIFINGEDTKSAQIFTLIHEIAHVWAGDSGLSDADPASSGSHAKELWANKVAAEVLVPSEILAQRYSGRTDSADLDALADYFKVSTLVVLKSIFDNGYLTWEEFRLQYANERHRVLSSMPAKSPSTGGDYYKVHPFRICGRQFVRAVVSDTLSGGTLYRDAYSLLGVSSHSTFEKLAEKVMS